MNKFSPLFWVSSSLFCAHQIIEIWWSIPYVHAYLDDLLAPSIVLGLCLAFFQNFFPGDPDFKLSLWQVLLFSLWYSLLFEYLFPRFDSRHYSDYVDIIFYFSGALIFFYWGNKPLTSGRVTLKED